MTPAIEELPVNDDAMDEDPARIALPVLLDLLPRLPEDLGAFLPHGSMFLMRIALRLLQRIPDQSTRAAVIRGVLHDTRILSGRLILLRVAGHREDIGTRLSTPRSPPSSRTSCATRSSPSRRATSRSRTASLASRISWPRRRTARLRCMALAEDDRVMLSLLLDCTGETRGRELGAAAVKVTKVLQWDRLAGWLGEDMLVRRVAEVFSAVADDGMEISEEEHAVWTSPQIMRLATGLRPHGNDWHAGTTWRIPQSLSRRREASGWR